MFINFNIIAIENALELKILRVFLFLSRASWELANGYLIQNNQY